MNGETGDQVLREALRAEIRDLGAEIHQHLATAAALDAVRTIRKRLLELMDATE